MELKNGHEDIIAPSHEKQDEVVMVKKYSKISHYKDSKFSKMKNTTMAY
jgi:hypothetical protein